MNSKDDLHRLYASELSKRGNRPVTEIAMKVFDWKKSTANNKAWEAMKHPAFIEEAARIQNLRNDDSPLEKDAKLTQNKILIDEAFRDRDVDAYLRLVALDNQMQGHQKATEIADDRKNAEVSLIGQLVKSLREKNRSDRIIDLPSANQQIIKSGD